MDNQINKFHDLFRNKLQAMITTCKSCSSKENCKNQKIIEEMWDGLAKLADDHPSPIDRCDVSNCEMPKEDYLGKPKIF